MNLSDFRKPGWAHGRFAVVKLWPGINTAEDENIARLKITASNLGLKCVEITPTGEIIGGGGGYIGKENCDFVIHLHFETPKAYDVYSFVALWNPVRFYHDWGYERFSGNLLSHDDFLSCESIWADDQVRRLVFGDPNYLPPEIKLFHSISSPIHAPVASAKKTIFYAGINWERLGKGRSRHQELLDRLDVSGNLSIFGPHVFQGVKVWEGYRSYKREIPFDGTSMIDEIAKCGVALVLSSDAHKESQLMSNRLFESLAAGVVIICDENPFARKQMGDSILYFDSRDPIDKQLLDIERHLNWISEHPEEARVLAVKAQKIFLDKFVLDKSIREIYESLPSRRKAIRAARLGRETEAPQVELNLLMPIFDLNVLKTHIRSAESQSYKSLRANLIVDSGAYQSWSDLIDAELTASCLDINVIQIDYFDHFSSPLHPRARRLGEIICELNSKGILSGYWLIVGPNERLFESHLEVLVGGLYVARVQGIPQVVRSIPTVVLTGFVIMIGPLR